MAAENLIKVGAVSGSGYFTVNGGGKFKADSITAESGWKTAATASSVAKTITQTSYATVGIVDDAGGWTITLGATSTDSARSASIKGSSKVYGTKLADSVSVGGTYVTVDLGAGNDTVVGLQSGNDYANIDLGAGNDSVVLAGDHVKVTAGEGADYVSIQGESANIDGGAGNDSIFVSGANAFVDGGEGNDVVSIGGDSATVYGGAGADSILVDGKEALVYGGDGNDTVSVSGEKATIYGGAGNDSILAAGNESFIDGGDGKDIISVGGSKATILGGAGNDSIVVSNTEATITLGDGKDTVSIGSTGATLTDYDYSTDTIVLGQDKGKTAPSDVVLTSDGMISVATGGADVKVNKTDGYYKAKLSGGQSYAWATDTATTIDLSSETKAFYVVTTDNDEYGDVVTGGRGNDSILVGSNDTVNGGRGNDSISVAAAATGVVVGLSANGGNDSIVGASVAGGNILGFSDDDLTITTDSAVTGVSTVAGTGLQISITGATVTLADTLDLTSSVDVKINNSGTLVNTEFVTGDATGIDADAKLVYGVGKKHALKLTGSDDYTVDLGYTGQYGDTRAYINIDSINASEGEGNYVLVGGTNGSTLQGGKTKTSLIGAGSGADSLVGGTGDDTFYYGAGSGKDTISGYGASGTDSLVFTSSDITGWTKDKKALTYTFSGTNQTLTIQDAGSGENTKYNYSIEGAGSGVSKIGYSDLANNFTYESDVTLYQGGSKTDKLVVSGSDDVQVWLDGQDKARTYSSIEYVDASSATGDVVLVGSTGNETLVGGTNNTLMFGGFGGNDVLVGSRQGETTFYFAKGCGNDTITASSSNDRVLLYGITLDDFDSTTSSGGTDLVIGLKDGSTLTVKGVASGVTTFVLGTSVDSGDTWTYDAASSKFTKAE